MTYGLKIDNNYGKLVLSSNATGYRYLGTAGRVQDPTRTGTFGTITSTRYSMNLPAGAVYPIVGITLDYISVVNAYPFTVAQQSTTLTYIIGIAGVKRAVDPATGIIYLDATILGGARLIGQNYGLLTVRDGCVYEGDKIVFGLNYQYNATYGWGYQAYYAPTDGSKPASYTPTMSTLYIDVDSVCINPDPKYYTNQQFITTQVHVFCPYINSDGYSGYGLNLYNASGDLSFSSKVTPLWPSAIYDFPAASITTSTSPSGSYPWTTVNGEDIYADGQSSGYNSLGAPILLIGQGNGYVEATRTTTSEDVYKMKFGWTTRGGKLARVPYVVTQTSRDFTSITDVATLSLTATKAIMVEGRDLFSYKQYNGYLVKYPTDASTGGTGTYYTAISPDGKHLYASNGTSNTITVFSRSTDFYGNLTYVQSISTNPYSSGYVTPCGIIISLDGTNVYVACGGSPGTILSYARNTSSGVLSSPSTTTSYNPYDPYFLCISPDGKHVYSAGFAGFSQPIYIYDRQTNGDLYRQSVSVYSSGGGNFCWTMSANGKYAYLSLYGSNLIAGYSRNSTTGALTLINAVSTGTNPSYSVLSSDNAYLYVSNYGSANLTIFSCNPSTGYLTYSSTVSIGYAPGGLVLSSDNNFLYCAIYGNNSIYTYNRDASTGALTPYNSGGSGYSISTGSNPYGMSISPDNGFIYAPNYGSGTVSQYIR